MISPRTNIKHFSIIINEKVEIKTMIYELNRGSEIN